METILTCKVSVCKMQHIILSMLIILKVIVCELLFLILYQN